jgi:uncharacterized protein (DUF934 family)
MAIDGMSSRILNRLAEGAEVERLFGELAQLEPVEVDFLVFSDGEIQHLRGFLTRLLNHINERSE